MSKQSIVKIAPDYSDQVGATLVLTSHEDHWDSSGGAWDVSLDDEKIGTVESWVESKSISLGGGSRLARNGAPRKYWGGTNVNGRAVTIVGGEATRLKVLRRLLDDYRTQQGLVAAREVAAQPWHWLRVENVPAYAYHSGVKVPDSLTQAAYWMDLDRRVPVTVFRAADAATLVEFAVEIEGGYFWSESATEETHALATATVAYPQDVRAALADAPRRDVRDQVAQVLLAETVAV